MADGEFRHSDRALLLHIFGILDRHTLILERIETMTDGKYQTDNQSSNQTQNRNQDDFQHIAKANQEASHEIMKHLHKLQNHDDPKVTEAAEQIEKHVHVYEQNNQKLAGSQYAGMGRSSSGERL